jgi:hypothetical protein
MSREITKDTRPYISLAGRPSNMGTRFHNFHYEKLGLDFVYKAFTTRNLGAAIAGIPGLGIRGRGVSIPYEQACIPYLDALEPSISAIGRWPWTGVLTRRLGTLRIRLLGAQGGAADRPGTLGLGGR